jgi:LPS sulfotransferase NodH
LNAAGFRSVILCATPRSGSTMMCDLMAASGVAGRPNSYFRRQSIADFASEWGIAPGPDFERRHFDAARRAGTDPSGMFALRLMWESLPELIALLARLEPGAGSDRESLARVFGTSLYIYLNRSDKIGQAVSRLRAEQSGLWHMAADGTDRERVKTETPVGYDAAQLALFLAEAEADERAWEAWFAEQDISPLRLTYDELSADPAASLGRVVAALGHDPASVAHIRPRTRRLADETSADWREKFEGQ